MLEREPDPNDTEAVAPKQARKGCRGGSSHPFEENYRVWGSNAVPENGDDERGVSVPSLGERGREPPDCSSKSQFKAKSQPRSSRWVVE